MKSLALALAALAAAGAARAAGFDAGPSGPTMTEFFEERGISLSTGSSFPGWFGDVSSPAVSGLKSMGSVQAVGLMEEPQGTPWQDRVFGCVLQGMADIQVQAARAADSISREDEIYPLIPEAADTETKLTWMTWGRPAFKLTTSSQHDGDGEASYTIILTPPPEVLASPEVTLYREATYHKRLAWSRSYRLWGPQGRRPQLDSKQLARALDAFRDAGFVLAKAHQSDQLLFSCSISMTGRNFRAAVEQLRNTGAAGAAAPPSTQPEFLKGRGVAYSTGSATPDWFVDVASPTAKALQENLPTYAVGLMPNLPGAAWQDQLFGCVIQAMAGVQEQAESFETSLTKDYQGDAPAGPEALASTTMKSFSKAMWGQPPFRIATLKRRYSSTVGRVDENYSSTTVSLLLPNDLLGMSKIGYTRTAVFESWLASSSAESGWNPREGPRLNSKRLARALDAFRNAGFVLARTHPSADGLRCSVSMTAKDFRAAVERAKPPATP